MPRQRIASDMLRELDEAAARARDMERQMNDERRRTYTDILGRSLADGYRYNSTRMVSFDEMPTHVYRTRQNHPESCNVSGRFSFPDTGCICDATVCYRERRLDITFHIASRHANYANALAIFSTTGIMNHAVAKLMQVATLICNTIDRGAHWESIGGNGSVGRMDSCGDTLERMYGNDTLRQIITLSFRR